jgi:hypothetical protein
MPASKTSSAGFGAPYCSGLPLVRVMNSFRFLATTSPGSDSTASAANRVKARWSVGTPATIFWTM